MKYVRNILIIATIVLFIWLMLQLINDMRQLNEQVANLHNQVVKLQKQQLTLYEHSKLQDKLIEEVAFEVHKPKPIQANQKNEYEIDVKDVVTTPTAPFIVGAVEMLKKAIFSW